jgi:hypothetical protein
MKSLLKSLSAFQNECTPIGKSASNPFFKSKFATLDAIQHHIKPFLAKNGLVITQVNKMAEGMPVVETNVWHVESGESISSIFPVVVTKATAQDYGSAVSYAKRYSLSGLLNLIIEDEDDDGNRASGSIISSAINAATPTAVTEKPWLNEKDPNWNAIVDKIKGGLQLTVLREHYKISAAVESKLKAAANVQA